MCYMFIIAKILFLKIIDKEFLGRYLVVIFLIIGRWILEFGKFACRAYFFILKDC
ncbi:MAG: hypothetical protein N2323_01840 [candidate division WOR-3 bacterium]|nr:hypothetical protein [candidate division WOR-3 bacterium]MCX7836689.1 hypothetical protein [candidate division WOR-3 bacterium]MDW8113474.1 hypothetical protein [candidate division WOR-3 bacterium]